LRATALQHEIQVLAFNSRFTNRVLRDHTAVVFNIDIKVAPGHNTRTKFQYFREPVGSQAVSRIVSDVCLNDHPFFFSRQPAAIDEVSNGIPNLGHMGVRGNAIAIRQNESRKGTWILLQCLLKITQFHP
jgi:hypothetical protein